MQPAPTKILVLSGHSATHQAAVRALRQVAEVIEAQDIDLAIKLLRSDQFAAIFSDAGDFLPIERALVSQQAGLILNTIGEGVCIVDAQGHITWMNQRLQGWPGRLHEEIRRNCAEAHEQFSRSGPQLAAESGAGQPHPARHKRYVLSLDDQLHWEMIVSPIVSPTGRVIQVVAVVWDNTPQRRLQQKLDAIDRAGKRTGATGVRQHCQA